MDEQEAFDNARGMFMTEGWKDFVEEVEGLIETLTLDAASTSDEFFHCKGRLEALRAIAGYENAVLASEAQYDDERVSH
ncbi:MAG: hypothetical protein P8P29_06415 [Flavobacteriaceae bacterium]|nr:hypothetical protein [Flavobacteriaceae bacterium]